MIVLLSDNYLTRFICSTFTYILFRKFTFYFNYINITFNIHGHITCNSTNLIYIIICSKCQKQYVGETGKKLKIRITEHLCNIRKHTNTIIGLHLNTLGHTI